MGVSKFIFDGEVKFDLTGDTLTKDKALKGYTFHDAAGDKQTGTCEYDVDSSAVTVKVAEVLAGKTFAGQGEIKTGTMKNNGAAFHMLSTLEEEYTIPQGYHDGSGKVSIDGSKAGGLIPTNIRQGIQILGVIGAMSATEGVNAQALTVTPKAAAQMIIPENGYNYFSQVTVEGIPYVESDNAAGGITITIG